VDLYGQEPEARLLGAFLSRLDNRTVIDVGAERGAFAQQMLRAGSGEIHLVEPEPGNVAFLRAEFGGDARVTVHEYALTDRDGETVELHKSVTPAGEPVSFGHTLLDRPSTDEIVWREVVEVSARSLRSLVEGGELPGRVGILKVDTEGYDLAVVTAMGALESDVVMVEHWTDLPNSLGPCPWNSSDMASALGPRGFSNFAFVEHRGEFPLVRWNDGNPPVGSFGNLVFLHDRVLASLLPDVLECASALSLRAVAVGEMYAEAATERMAHIEDLTAQLQTQLEAQQLVDAGNGRESHIEDALRQDGRRRLRRRNRTLAKLIARARSWRQPRIGILRHYHAKPLAVPTHDTRTAAPANALKISIVTPSFEQGRFLDRTIYSVVTQNYPSLEYVVQDGGSTDNTVDVLRRFDRLLTAWTSEQDAGQADAINRGFARTNGEIMAWLNSDDLLLPGALAVVAGYFAQHPEVDVVYGNRVMIDESDGQIGAWVLPKHDDRALTLADYVPQETLFWRRRIWNAVGGFVDTEFKFAVDWDLLLRFRHAGAKIVHVPRFLGAFRVHADQKTFVERKVGQAECELLRERVHGRSLTSDEILDGLHRYFARHVRVHNRQRFLDRLPIARIRVQTAPREPSLAKPEDEAGRGALQVAQADLPTPVSPLAPPSGFSLQPGELEENEGPSRPARQVGGR